MTDVEYLRHEADMCHGDELFESAERFRKIADRLESLEEMAAKASKPRNPQPPKPRG